VRFVRSLFRGLEREREREGEKKREENEEEEGKNMTKGRGTEEQKNRRTERKRGKERIVYRFEFDRDIRGSRGFALRFVRLRDSQQVGLDVRHMNTQMTMVRERGGRSGRRGVRRGRGRRRRRI
jgi:hypothetical protein